MERDNYFAQRITEQIQQEARLRVADVEAGRLRDEIFAQTQEKQAEERIKIVQMQNERDRLKVGTPPQEVWGTEAARLCQEFLAYMKDVPEISGRHESISKVVIPRRVERARVRLIPPKYEETEIFPSRTFYGYRIAFSDPDKSCSSWADNGVCTRENGSRPPDTPNPDVMLCKDGLLRRVEYASALTVCGSDGSVIKPEVGKIRLDHRNYERSVHTYPNHECGAITQFTDYTAAFQSLELSQMLYDIALNVTRVVDGLK